MVHKKNNKFSGDFQMKKGTEVPLCYLITFVFECVY